MNWNLIAAAGIAEAAWMFARLLMYAGLFVVGFFAAVAAANGSRKLANVALAALVIFCVLFQPWGCFAPFAAEAYDDPDVVYHAAEFRLVGIVWIGVSLFTLISFGAAWSKASRQKPPDAAKST
jgi:hypothetical protein